MVKETLKINTDLNSFQERVEEIFGDTPAESVNRAATKLRRLLQENPDCPGACAPQVFENLRMFVVRTNENTFKTFLNPIIVSSEGGHLSRETNISFPDKQFIILRKDKIHVAYQTEDGHVDSETFLGAYGEVVQQMIEMLDGILLSDLGFDLDIVGGPKAFDDATDDEKSEVLAMYVNSIKDTYAGLRNEIDNDPALKEFDDAINKATQILIDGPEKESTEEPNKESVETSDKVINLEEVKKTHKKKKESEDK